MEPRLNPSLTPNFWEMDPIKDFQPMCRDLLMQEQGISIAEIYGVSGQKQYGIDILAKDINNKPYVVGQCKCYKNFLGNDLIKAVDEFLYPENFKKWYQQGVKKFILFIACDLELIQQQDEISRQTGRLLDKGVIFEVWSGSVIRNRLAPYREIASRYIHSGETVKNICGVDPQFSLFQGDDLTKTLNDLHDAIRDPSYYFQDIQQLLKREAESLYHEMSNPTSEYGWIISFLDERICLTYLNHLSMISQRFLCIVLNLIRLDKDKNFHKVLINSLSILAKDLMPLNTSFSKEIPNIRLYPLLLIIFAIFLAGIEYKEYSLIKQISEIPFRSTQIIYTPPKILVQVINRILMQHNFFRIAKPQSYAPISVLLQEHLDSHNISDIFYGSLKESFYKGEFIFSLMYLQLSQSDIWPGQFLYMPEARRTLETFVNPTNLPNELFLDLENLLKKFDQCSLEINAAYGRMYGFYGISYKTYLASK